MEGILTLSPPTGVLPLTLPPELLLKSDPRENGKVGWRKSWWMGEGSGPAFR